MRGRLPWLLATPLVAIGTLGGHALGYRVALADPAERAQVLERSGHAYLDHAPLALGLCLAFVAVALVLRGVAAARGTTGRATPPYAFAVLPPAVYFVQEHVERVLHSGHVDWATALEPPFLVGLLLQVPFALAALLLARVLTALADAVGRSFAGGYGRARLSSIAILARPSAARLPRVRVAGLAHGERGPPSLG